MDSAAFPTHSTPMRDCHACTMGQGVCNGEKVAITTSWAREVFIRCAPITTSGTAHEQAQKFYGCLPRLLSEAGAEMADVVLERVFFRDIHGDFEVFDEARREAYEWAGVRGDRLPAASYIEQPPCHPIQAFELQVYAVASNGNGQVRIHSFPNTEQNGTAKVVEIGGYRHLYLMNVTGKGPDGQPLGPFREQSDTMFATGSKLLRCHGTSFSEVLRTWCYLDEIDRDYDEFNLSRNVFFERENVQRLPASTGIRSGLYPQGTLCSFDLYALLNPDGAKAEVMHTPTLNEADEYGSAFSRGMKLALPDKTVLFISGTASVDERGETVHVDNSRQQIERMLLNIRELLMPHGATFADVAQVITYLKSASDLDLLLEICDRCGLTGMPNTIVEAGVCRPNLLCEMEALVIIPSPNKEEVPSVQATADTP